MPEPIVSPSGLIEAEMDPGNKHVRLVFCHTCSSVNQIPDYKGPPEYDHYLRYITDQHQTEGHPHRGAMARCKDTPDMINAAIDEMENNVNEVRAGAGAGLGQAMYDLRDNNNVEAMQCWKRHSRTRDCADYRSEPKRLWIDTKADRRDAGMSTRREDRPNIWLCDHCPVHSIIQQKQNQAAGLDK